jgi:hypothetical protein
MDNPLRLGELRNLQRRRHRCALAGILATDVKLSLRRRRQDKLWQNQRGAPSQAPRNFVHFLLGTDSTAAVGRGNGPKVQSSRKMDARLGDLCELASGQSRGGRCIFSDLRNVRIGVGVSDRVQFGTSHNVHRTRPPGRGGPNASGRSPSSLPSPACRAGKTRQTRTPKGQRPGRLRSRRQRGDGLLVPFVPPSTGGYVADPLEVNTISIEPNGKRPGLRPFRSGWMLLFPGL